MLILACHAVPQALQPGSKQLVLAHLGMGSLTLFLTYLLWAADPYHYGMLYSGALMVLCTECWYTDDPQLFNGSKTRGWPFFLFRRPGSDSSMAVVPMASYTRIFSAWHAGGVCLCFFMHVLALNFPAPQKAAVSLALGLLWIIWASINQWRFIYGGAQFCQIGISFHSLVGPGCGLLGYWHLSFWLHNRIQSAEEMVLLVTFAAFVVATTFWLATHERAASDVREPLTSQM